MPAMDISSTSRQEPRGDQWAQNAEWFVDDHYASLGGRVRHHVIDAHLRCHLPPAPAKIVDVGGGAGNQSIPLARDGYRVTIVDPSATMLAHAADVVSGEPQEVRDRITLVEGDGEAAIKLLEGQRFAAVLCHAVLMYVDDPDPLVGALASLADEGAIVSIVAMNARTLAVRPAIAGNWKEALASFDRDGETNRLGIDVRGDTVEGLSEHLGNHGVETLAWYGVRLFTDGYRSLADGGPDSHSVNVEADVLAVELEASRRDPYRQLSHLFHIVGVRGRGR